jgi:hypothetical protein
MKSKHYKWQARWSVDRIAMTAQHDSGLVFSSAGVLLLERTQPGAWWSFSATTDHTTCLRGSSACRGRRQPSMPAPNQGMPGSEMSWGAEATREHPSDSGDRRPARHSQYLG